MPSLYETVVHDHDLRYVALAIGICAIGSLTGAAIAQYSLKQVVHRNRLNWLLLAGLVTGLGVWATHFAAMLGYRRDLGIRFDLVDASFALLMSVGVTLAGGAFGLLWRERGVATGVILGVGIAVAHYMDMQALWIPGSIVHDPITNALAVALGIGFGVLAGHLLVSWKEQILAWPAAIALFTAVVSLHFTAMSGVTIVPGGELEHGAGMIASADELAAVVVAVFLVLLGAAVTYTWQSERASRLTAEKQQRLISALEALQETQDHHRAYVELNPQIAWLADRAGRVTELAPLWGELTGIPHEQGVGENWASVIHPDDLPVVKARWQEAVTTGDGERADTRYRIRLADGSYRWFRARARPRKDENGNILAWYGSLEDIHEHVIAETALRASEERYRLASLAANDVIWDWSFERERAKWGGAYEKVLGFPELEHETELNWWLDHIHPDDRKRVLASQARALESGADFWHEEYRFLVASGDWIDVRSRCVIVRNEEGQSVRLVGSMLDITQQKKAEAELNWAAYHDSLTKLPNRALYRKHKRVAIDAARQSGRFVAVMVLDLNNFKELNDTLGHVAGDRVLEETARRLTEALPGEVTVARLGGDEFAVILPDLPEADAYKDHVDKIRESLGKPIEFRNMRVPISYCAGVAIWPRDSDDPAELLIAADLALYAAKEELPGTILEFTPSLKDASDRRSGMLTAARQALEEDRVVPFYQPKIDFRTGRIMGWEALLRIRGENLHILPPSEIAAAFSDADITVQLTDRMFARVFADIARWRQAGIDPGRIAVNVSAGDFRQSGLAERLKFHAEANQQSLSQIDIEVTETVLIGELGPEVSRMLEELRTLGVMVALDDFGTGYASLSHLQQFPVDVIKIDKSFIEQIDEKDPKATAVIDAVIQMARRLGMQTVAEGIETPEECRYLRARNCTIGQGFLFSRPVAADEVPSLLASKGGALLPQSPS